MNLIERMNFDGTNLKILSVYDLLVLYTVVEFEVPLNLDVQEHVMLEHKTHSNRDTY